jgi:hypothetical protein
MVAQMNDLKFKSQNIYTDFDIHPDTMKDWLQS